MGVPAREIDFDQVEMVDTKNSSMKVDKTFTDEIVIGICGQLGVDLEIFSKELSDILSEDYLYQCQEIKMSSFIFKYADVIPPANLYDRIIAGMEKGDELRSKFSHNILADFAIAQIGRTRIEDTLPEDIKIGKFNSRRKCFIINSIKHPSEYELLKKVYKDSLYMIGVFSPYDERVEFLKSKFNRKNHDKIDTLIDRDTAEDIQNGQNVEGAFIHSDYFIRTFTGDKTMKLKLEKFLNLIFDFGINTPTIEERAMYQATSASANSACLSRQVGACITDKYGEVLSIGWNDVPSPGGGVYYTEKPNDQRCYVRGFCANSQKKDELRKNMIGGLLNKNIITEEQEIVASEILNKNGLKNLIEFARSIHAEMHALILGCQNTGNRMVGGKLFCTTYPCHNCARHIVLAGLKEVYYIEPYRKSLCLELHDDAITEDEKCTGTKVKFLMYEGVAPKSFIKLYQVNSDNRKIKLNNQNKNLLIPKYRITLRAVNELESISANCLKSNNLPLV